MALDMNELCQNNILSYSSAVNQSRAIPDAATGLKPIHQKILYEMYADKIFHDKKYRKCAYMVGQIISRFSEHGDAATYDALVRLSQPWLQLYPLVDLHGNGGSQFGDPQAAMRYVEGRLSAISEEGFLSSLDKNSVEWKMNYTNEEKEPVSLPAVFPGLFCLPNQGMGYACACYFLTYNIQDAAQAIKEYISNGDIKTQIYFDLASGGAIINPEEMVKLQNTGKGNIIVDSIYHIEGNKIVFTEIPFNVMFDDILENIAEVCEKYEYKSVRQIYNDSGKNQLRLVVECIPKTNLEETAEWLLSNTKLRNKYPVNQVALVDNQPKLLSLKDMCDVYVKHNLACIKREHLFDLNKTKDRIEILEGLERAYNGLDNVINLIRNSKSAQDAKDYMIKNLNLTERQADAILALKLSRLAHLEKQQILDELEEKRKLAKELEEIVGSENRQKEILITRLTNLVKKYGTPRRTQIIQKTITKRTAAKTKKQVIAEDVIIALDKNGYMKSIPVAKFKSSSNNIQEVKAKTDSILNLFSSDGYCYRLKASAIKSCLNSDKGTALGSILQLNPQAQIKVFSVCGQEVRVFFATKMGKVKILNSRDMDGTTQNLRGMSVIKLAADDSLVEVAEVQDNHYVSLYTKDRGLVFDIAEINLSGKASSGRKGISLGKDEYVTKANLLKENKSNGIFTLPIKHIGTRGTPWTSN